MTRTARCCIGIALLAAALPAQTGDGKDVAVYRRGDRPDRGARLAVVVGIDAYEKGTGLPRLRFAEKDARDVAAALRGAGFAVTLMVPGEDPAPWTGGADAVAERAQHVVEPGHHPGRSEHPSPASTWARWRRRPCGGVRRVANRYDPAVLAGQQDDCRNPGGEQGLAFAFLSCLEMARRRGRRRSQVWPRDLPLL